VTYTLVQFPLTGIHCDPQDFCNGVNLLGRFRELPSAGMTALTSQHALLSLKMLVCLPFHSKECWRIEQLTFLLLKQLIAKIKDMTRAKY